MTSADLLAQHVARIAAQLAARVPADLAGLPDLLFNALKLQEEAGEVAAALSGVYGHNPRKGVTHTIDDVAAEAFDVAMSALVLAEKVRPGFMAEIMPARLELLAARACRSGAPEVHA